MSFKIAFIGAGSLVFARTLFTDILSVPEFHDIEIAFTDINPENLERTRQLCQRDLDANGIPITIQATTDRREAFHSARYIINCVRIGGLEGFETDIEIPLKYGVDQCVGDTLCTGGIMYGQRVIAALLDFCKDIREVAEPGAIMLNYSNPNAMATWACNKYGRVRTIGLCHGEIHGEMQIAEVLGIPREELDINKRIQKLVRYGFPANTRRTSQKTGRLRKGQRTLFLYYRIPGNRKKISRTF